MIMGDYRTGGIPWTIVIGPDRTVLLNSFQIELEQVRSGFARISEHLDASEPERIDG